MGFWHTNGSPNLDQKTRSSNNQQKKRTYRIVDFAIQADHRVKLKECEMKDIAPTLPGIEKTVEHESGDYTNCSWCCWYCHQRISTRTGGLRNNRTSGDHPKYGIIELDQNTEKSPGHLTRLVTQTPVRNHQLTPVWKALKREDNILLFWEFFTPALADGF